MDEYKQHLRRLAVHDEALFEAIASDGGAFTGLIDQRTAALVRVAATRTSAAVLASMTDVADELASTAIASRSASSCTASRRRRCV